MRRITKVLLALTTLVAIGVGLVVWLIWFSPWASFPASPAPIQYDTATQLAGVSVPHHPQSLAWSADGAYLAAGAWGWGDANEEPGPSELYVVDVANASVAATLKAPGVVQGLAFSQDRKWLAVATRPSPWHPIPAQPAVVEKKNPPPAAGADEVVVFDVPAFTARFTANRSGVLQAVDHAQGLAVPRPREVDETVLPLLKRSPPHSPVVSRDGSKQALGYTRIRGFGDLGWDNRHNEFGSFVRVTESATGKTWTWRVGEAQAIADAPAVAFSPDGRKLAGTVKQPSAGSILIWAVPK